MKRLPIAYQGFKLGVRIADKLALSLDVHKPMVFDIEQAIAKAEGK